jgi:hypothetical protein
MNKTKNCDPYGHSEDLKEDLKECGCGTLLLNNKCPHGHSEDLKECGCGTRLQHNKCPHGHYSSEDLKGKCFYKGIKLCGGCGSLLTTTLLTYNRCPNNNCDWRNW